MFWVIEEIFFDYKTYIFSIKVKLETQVLLK
jgi:hypothetical protein